MMRWLKFTGWRAKVSAAVGVFLIAIGVFIRSLIVSNARLKHDLHQIEDRNEKASDIRRLVHTPDPDGMRELAGRGYRDRGSE